MGTGDGNSEKVEGLLLGLCRMGGEGEGSDNGDHSDDRIACRRHFAREQICRFNNYFNDSVSINLSVNSRNKGRPSIQPRWILPVGLVADHVLLSILVVAANLKSQPHRTRL
jgi:hypothetical protein